jgi:adenylate cyclase
LATAALSQRDSKLAVELLEEHRELLRKIFPEYNATEIKTIGDAFLVEFQSALEAAQCAIAIQRALAKRDADAPANRQIQVRIGVHIGDVVHRGGDVYGDGVNIASRIEPLADAGGICVSMDVERQIRNALETRFEKLAPTELKNISVSMDLFRIVLPWEKQAASATPSQATPKARSNRGLWIAALIIAVVLIAGAGGFYISSHRFGSTAIPEKSVAVLPFENLSDEKQNAYFTDGVQDEILTDLAKIADLKVISRTSVMQYKSGAPRNLREIGQQLGVVHLLEGSVQRAANKIRVNAQLIDARNDAHLWAQTYDRDLADVFAIQSEIAKAIADQLQAKLSPTEKKAIEQPPTPDLAAFDLYSRAKSLLLTASFGATQDPDVRKAIELLDEAVKRDPSFFDAYCQLADAHEWLYAVLGSDHTPARLALAEAALENATRLRPDAAETHLARAQYLYYGRRDYAGALAELERLRRTLPNDPRLFELTGYILRRRGQQEEGLRNLQRAVELDPWNLFTLQQIAISYQYFGRYAEAIAALDRALGIVPDNVETRTNRALFELCWKGDTQPLHQTIDAVLAQGPSAIAPAADTWFACALAERNSAAAERALVALGDNPCWGDGPVQLSHSFGEGLLARMTKDEARAHAAFEAARAQQEKIVQAQPDYGPALCVLAMIDAGLGRKEQALEEGRRAIALMPLEKDIKNGSLVLQYFAITAAWAGEKELVLQQLETGLRAPAASIALSYGALKLLPFWDPVRGDPRFERIVASLAPKQ